jgi:hypothetical protein
MLVDSEITQIISDFPNIKLSYENIAHKKVSNYDFVSAIPEGDKYFAWFTIHNNKNVCLLMKIEKNKDLSNVKIVNCCFNSELSYGTILYGTLFHHRNTNFFSIEDIFYYKSKNVSNYTWKLKLDLFEIIMKNDIRQVSYNNSFITFGLPVIKTNMNDLNKVISDLKYTVHCKQFRSFHKSNVSEYILMSENTVEENTGAIKREQHYNNPATLRKKEIYYRNETPIKNNNSNSNNSNNNTNNANNNSKKEVIFNIKPDIQNDIYHLYCLNENNVECYYDIAYIPDFTTSVMMNKLFRNIKENNNLDALEESDDEDEFENEREDRFVFLEKTYNMVCAYNYKFKKWYPIKIAYANKNITKQKDLPNISK